eukprot:SAG31_NODE_34050_length_337_cov_0.823529_1_plen_45_part_10
MMPGTNDSFGTLGKAGFMPYTLLTTVLQRLVWFGPREACSPSRSL